MLETEVSIACSVDEAFVPPLLVMLSSLKEHLAAEAHPMLYLAHRGLSDDSRERIARLLETRPLSFTATSLAGLPAYRELPPEAAAPLLLADLLPAGVRRVLFLDADLLVLDDLSRLWRTELGENVLAAVQDRAVPCCGSPRGVKDRPAWGVPDDAPYFNAGVLLIDLDAWRERGVTQSALDYIERTGDRLDLQHQEALNATLWNSWLPLPERWNLLGGLAGLPFERPPSEAWRDPGIIHFAGRFKPWRAPIGGRFAAAYQEAVERAGDLPERPRATLRERLESVYDRRLRRYLFPIESYLWKRRVL